MLRQKIDLFLILIVFSFTISVVLGFSDSDEEWFERKRKEFLEEKKRKKFLFE